jgi:hypothetical protein
MEIWGRTERDWRKLEEEEEEAKAVALFYSRN